MLGGPVFWPDFLGLGQNPSKSWKNSSNSIKFLLVYGLNPILLSYFSGWNKALQLTLGPTPGPTPGTSPALTPFHGDRHLVHAIIWGAFPNNIYDIYLVDYGLGNMLSYMLVLRNICCIYIYICCQYYIYHYIYLFGSEKYYAQKNGYKTIHFMKRIDIYIYIHILVGGFNLSEKYESQLGWLFPYIMVNKKCSKPPTSHYIHIFAI